MTMRTHIQSIHQDVLEYIGECTGLIFAEHRRRDAEAGINRAMVRAGIKHTGQYFRSLRAKKDLFDDLIVELTIGETYFFRHPAQLDFIRQEILPDIRRYRGPEHTIHAWSAACASGEEAYTLAIMLEQMGMADSASILATDISMASLGKARDGIYTPWALRNSDEHFINRYFKRIGKRFELTERFRRRVRFEQLNLASDHYPSAATGTQGLDMILCRNVLIYFDRKTIDRVAERLFRSLAVGGWLVTAPSDPPLPESLPRETVTSPAGIFYRRIDKDDERNTVLRNPSLQNPDAPARQDIPTIASLTTTWAPPLVSPPTAPLPPVESAQIKTPVIHDTPIPLTAREPEASANPLAEATVAFADGDYQQAMALSTSLSDVEAYSLRLHSLINLGESAEAERIACEAVAKHPLSAEIHFLRTIMLMDMGRLDEAAKAAQRAAYLDRSLIMVHVVMASVLRRLGDATGARRACRAAYALASSRPEDEVVPLSEGALAGQLAETAKAELSLLDAEPKEGK